MKRFVDFLILVSVLVLVSCGKVEPDVSFYYWKTNATLSLTEKQALSQYHCKDLYVRFFDVDVLNDSIIPLGVLSHPDSLPKGVSIIPVVFITNRTFKKTDSKQVKQLANHIYDKINKMLTDAGRSAKEIQMDCDWSDDTKLNYFEFLECLSDKFKQTPLSCTIRLHQIKYPLRTGIPPVKKGMAMIYNMGNINQLQENNSICNEAILKQYVAYLGTYPLSLDIALPVFSWQAKYRNNKLMDIIEKDQGVDTSDSKLISRTDSAQIFRINSSFLHGGRYYMEGDKIKVECIGDDQLIKISEIIAGNVKDGYQPKIVFFDLDDYNLKRYKNETIEEIIANFN